jgi:3-oxoacyl-[acyl-carrier protein] reductase
MSKIIVITGTRKGIGKALSEYYLNKGFVVIGCSRREASITNAK